MCFVHAIRNSRCLLFIGMKCIADVALVEFGDFAVTEFTVEFTLLCTILNAVLCKMVGQIPIYTVAS